MRAILLQTADEWHTLYEALSQYVENLGDHVEQLDDDDDPQARASLERAERVLGAMDADLAALTNDNHEEV
jgi:hypothetical protein